MPAVISYDMWKSQTSKISVFKQSAELKEVTESFKLYSMSKMPTKLQSLDIKFKAWNNKNTTVINKEKLTLGTAVANLAYTIANAPGFSVGSSISPSGWNHVPWTSPPYTWTTAVPNSNKQGDLSSIQITQINEAFRRAKKGVQLARDELIKLNPSSFTQSTLSFTAKAYVDYFGAYDSKRFQEVLRNMGFLTLAFEDKAHTPNVIDLRDTQYGMTCYAACFRNDLRNTSSSQALTGHVNIFLGRSFFLGSVGSSKKSSYSESSDATITTLVHEFAHGAINAVDAPPVDSSNNWKLAPAHLTDPTHADHGETPQNDIQASTPSDDKKLALKAPSVAIRNADCYGQFVKEHLMNIKQ